MRMNMNTLSEEKNMVSKSNKNSMNGTNGMGGMRGMKWIVVLLAVFLIQPLSQGAADFPRLNITQEQMLNLSDDEVETVIDNSLLDGYALYEYLTDATQY